MDNISDRSFRKLDIEQNSSTTALSGIVNDGTSVELDEVDLRNGIDEFHQTEVKHRLHLVSIVYDQYIEINFFLIDSGFIGYTNGSIEKFPTSR